MEELNTPIFAQAKVEYTNQLIDILYPHIYDGVRSIYDEAKIIFLRKNNTPKLLLFREILEKVPIWNNEIINSTSEEDVDRTSSEGKASSVQFVHFNFTDEQIIKFKNLENEVFLGINHNLYNHTTKIFEYTRKALIKDFI